jgi:hypothetical protein
VPVPNEREENLNPQNKYVFSPMTLVCRRSASGRDIKVAGDSTMKQFQRKFAKRRQIVLNGAMLLAILVASGAALAGPKAPGGDKPGHGKPGAGANPSEVFGRPPPGHHGAAGPAGSAAEMHEHGHHGMGAAGAPGLEDHHHGMAHFKQRLAELKQKETAGTLTPPERQELDRLEKMPKMPMGPGERKARLDELTEKESSGKASDADKAELEKLKQIQARHDAMRKRMAEMAEHRKERARDAKRQALKEFPQLNKDAAALAEYQKHGDRLAKLERAKDLAAADQRTELVQKIEALISKENARHQAWLSQHKPNTQAPSQGAAQ